MTTTLPLFPLSTVLFPGARLPLRIFESRYLDMVRECLRNESGFGVVWRMDTDPAELGGHARIGTEAVIQDFSTLEDGLLGIECLGQRRFVVRSTTARDNGLLIGQVDWFTDQPATAVAPRHGALQGLLREIQAHKELGTHIQADADDAVGLGFGLAAVLPIDRARAQNLLEMTDATQRLDALLDMIDSTMNSDSSA
jgi:uncharacterized protein